jgi:hypothetical protein
LLPSPSLHFRSELTVIHLIHERARSAPASPRSQVALESVTTPEPAQRGSGLLPQRHEDKRDLTANGRDIASIKDSDVVSSLCSRCDGMDGYTPARSPTIFRMCPTLEGVGCISGCLPPSLKPKNMLSGSTRAFSGLARMTSTRNRRYSSCDISLLAFCSARGGNRQADPLHGHLP